ncbi:MAG TPA: hypothetical protein VJP02_24895 [Candidatus Sulfotelmatobacter sp.]|nr:hypothetical protein [Candidatus Sulfotelmatobacter sp.]
MRWIPILLLFAGFSLAAQDMDSCPMHKELMKQASQHQADVETNGDEAMGFFHDKTTHHFRLNADGGTIEVTANDAKDEGNIQAIRSHLKHIAAMFSHGDFSAPMFIHDQAPPGVSVLKEKRAEISYSFEEVAAGGKVRIKTADPESLKAIHEFLRFQITDHHTGDSPDIASQ